jgi:quercetin dioxygenase-like cupin family protein
MSEARTTPYTGDIGTMIEYATDGIVSKTVVDEPRVKAVLFSMSAGQSLSEHTASMPASIHVLEGEASILLGETRHPSPPGTYIYMPANLNHAVDAVTDTVFLLHLHRGEA